MGLAKGKLMTNLKVYRYIEYIVGFFLSFGKKECLEWKLPLKTQGEELQKSEIMQDEYDYPFLDMCKLIPI